MQLHEQFRPKRFEDVVGQEKAIAKLQQLAKRDLGGRVYWITGSSGTGKTTLARIIASEVADDFAVIEIDGSDLSMDRVREYERMCRSKPIGGGFHVFIINEAHGLSGRVVRRLNSTFEMESVQNNSTWIFTTTVEGEENLFEGEIETVPFTSRCVTLPLSRRGLAEPFAKRAKEIAEREGLDGLTIEKYIRLLHDNKNNLRAALQFIESGGMLDCDK